MGGSTPLRPGDPSSPSIGCKAGVLYLIVTDPVSGKDVSAVLGPEELRELVRIAVAELRDDNSLKDEAIYRAVGEGITPDEDDYYVGTF